MEKEITLINNNNELHNPKALGLKIAENPDIYEYKNKPI